MLTKECANCPWWKDTEKEWGCARPRPIDECEAFANRYSSEEIEDEEYFDDYYDEVGYNPYMGCYDFDCQSELFFYLFIEHMFGRSGPVVRATL